MRIEMAKEKDKPQENQESAKHKAERILLQFYLPADNDTTTCRMTTMQVFDFLQNILPSDKYMPEDVYDLLMKNDFRLHRLSVGAMWMMREL